MQIFYLMIGRDKLYLYEKSGTKYQRQSIEGKDGFEYEVNRAKADTEQMIEILVNEFNLDTSAELSFYVLKNRDEIRTEAVMEGLGEFVQDSYELESILIQVIGRLKKDKKLMIEQYGINFDGENYRLVGKKLEMEEFNLLGYTLKEDLLMGLMDV